MAASLYQVILNDVENHIFRHNRIFIHTCMYKQIYYIGFPGYLTVLLDSDFYFIFLCCGIVLKFELSCIFLAEFVIQDGSGERYIPPLCHDRKLLNSLFIMSKSLGSSSYLNKLRLSVKKW